MSGRPWRWLWRGRLAPAAIRVDYRPELPKLGADLRRALERSWARRIARADKVRLVDDPVAPLLDHRIAGKSLALTLGRSRYSHWLYSAERAASGRALDAPCRPLALCAALISREGSLIIQRRSDAVAEGAGLLHVPGGHLDPDRHRLAGAPHPTVAMLAEIEEELGLGDEHLSGGRLLGLIENLENGKPELLYTWAVSLDAEAIMAAAAGAVDRFEADQLRFPGREEWDSLMREGPVAIPTRALLEALLAVEPG